MLNEGWTGAEAPGLATLAWLLTYALPLNWERPF